MHTRIAIGLLALTAGSLSVPASAKVLKPVPDAALDSLRGGFISAGGLVFDIGITTSTYINGQLALKTSVATSPTTPTGPTGPTGPTAPTAPAANPPPRTGPALTPTVTVSASTTGSAPTDPPPGTLPETPSPPPTSGPTGGPVTAAAVNTPAPQNQTPQNQTPQNQTPQNQAPQNQTPQNPDPPSPAAQGQTVTASTPDGQTTVIQNPGQLVNVVTNAANGQDIRLDTVVNLVLPGFDAVQRNQLLSGMGMKMSADGSFGIVSALPH